MSELSGEEIEKMCDEAVGLSGRWKRKNANALRDMAEKWRASQEAGMVSVHRSAIEAINTDAWSDEKVRMRSIARLTDAMLAAAQKGEA